MKAALYARVSTDQQDLQPQLRDLREFAAARGWTVVGAYQDVASGATPRRIGLDALLADAHKRRFRLVVVWRLDRLGRSLAHMVEVVEGLLSRGIDLVSMTEPHLDSTTPQGRLLRNIFASVAEYERELIRERVRAGMRWARSHGTRSGRAIGRPKVEVDVARARALLIEGVSLRKTAGALGVDRTTLARALGVAQKGAPAEGPSRPRRGEAAGA